MIIWALPKVLYKIARRTAEDMVMNKIEFFLEKFLLPECFFSVLSFLLNQTFSIPLILSDVLYDFISISDFLFFSSFTVTPFSFLGPTISAIDFLIARVAIVSFPSFLTSVDSSFLSS